jgi:hypothetical protein
VQGITLHISLCAEGKDCIHIAMLGRRTGSLTKIREKDRSSTYKGSRELYARTVGLRTVVDIQILMGIQIVREITDYCSSLNNIDRRRANCDKLKPPIVELAT